MDCIYCLILAFIGFFGWPFLLPWLEAKAWRELARRTGLTYEPRSGFLGIPRRGRVIGPYRGRLLTLDTFSVDTYYGDTSDHSTGRSVSLNMRIVLSLNNQAKGVLPLPNASSAGQDFQKPQGNSGVKVSEAFDQKLRSILGGTQGYDIKVNGEQLQFVKGTAFGYFQGVERNVERLILLFDTLCDVAEAVEQAGKGE